MSATPLSTTSTRVSRSLYKAIEKELYDKGYSLDLSSITQLPIVNFTLPNNVSVSGDHSAGLLSPGRVIQLVSTAGNDGQKTILLSIYDSGSNRTIITVTPNLAMALGAGGRIDVDTYYDDNAGVAKYAQDLTAIFNSKGFAVEIFGVGSSQKRYLKKVPRVVIEQGNNLPGALGGAQGLSYSPGINNTFTSKMTPPQTKSIYFSVRLVWKTIQQLRVMEAAMGLSLPVRGYINDHIDPTIKYFITQNSFSSIPDTVEGLGEFIYGYQVHDLYETEEVVIRTGISTITEITVEPHADLPTENDINPDPTDNFVIT